MKPYTSAELLELATSGTPIDPLRVVSTYSHPSNWVGVYDGADCDGQKYPKAWAWRGPVIVGPELAQNAVERLAKVDDVLHWAQATLTALNTGHVYSGSKLHLKLREVMIALRA